MADVKKPTDAEIQAAIARINKEKEARAKFKERLQNDPALKAKRQEAGRRKVAKTILTLQKALAAGITVSDKEIDAYLAKKK